MTVSARRRAWVRLGTDGTSGTSGFLQAGDKRVPTATREVNIHSGDAGALLVSVNGAPASPFGKDGAVLTRRLTAASDVAPSAQPAPVATRGSAVPASGAKAAEVTRPPLNTALPNSALTSTAPPSGGVKAATTPAAAPLAPATPPASLADATGGADPAQAVRGPATARDAAGTTPVATTGRSDATAVDPSGSKLTRTDLLQLEHAWFDAHYRGDHAAMGRIAAREFDLKDDRTSRPTPGITSMERTVRNLAVDIWGGGAVVTGLMSERPKGAADAVESSFVETWIQRDGRWQMLGLRLLPPQPAPR